MRTLSISFLIFSLLCVLTAAQQKRPADALEFKPGQSVYVVAVKSNGTFASLASASISRSNPPLPGRAMLERSKERAYDLAQPDPVIKSRIEEEFRKHKMFSLAPSIEKADFVFFVWAEYVFYRPRQMGEMGPRTEILSRDCYGTPNMLGRLTAMAMPTASYQQSREYYYAMIRAAHWEEGVKY
jgi:hypothetical protein